MSGSASEQTLARERLRSALAPLLRQLAIFSDSTRPKEEPPLLRIPEEQIRTVVECLFALGLDQDAQRVVHTWHALHQWAIRFGFNEVLAKWAERQPEKRQRLRELFGEFPSTKELQASKQHQLARAHAQQSGPELAGHLQELSSMLSALDKVAQTPGTSGVDDSAFVPMSKLPWLDRLGSLPACSRFLDRHTKEIRQRKPNKNRREVHLPDWHRYWTSIDKIRADALGDGSIEEVIAQIESRKADQRAHKVRR